jgi:predicted RNase H-like HicB family nuclease
MTAGRPREYDVVVERDGEGFYVASVPALPGCHTQARSLDDLTERIKEAIELCLEVGARKKDGGPVAAPADGGWESSSRR